MHGEFTSNSLVIASSMPSASTLSYGLAFAELCLAILLFPIDAGKRRQLGPRMLFSYTTATVLVLLLLI
jgi:hypothetical protein